MLSAARWRVKRRQAWTARLGYDFSATLKIPATKRGPGMRDDDLCSMPATEALGPGVELPDSWCRHVRKGSQLSVEIANRAAALL